MMAGNLAGLAPRTLLVMAGGTDGHTFLAPSVVKLLATRGWKVAWFGNTSGMEGQLMPKYGFPLESVQFGGLHGKGLVIKFLLPLNLLRASWRSLGAVRRVRSDVVLGMGGYITFLSGMISVLLGRPLMLYKQSSIARLANYAFARVADRVLYAFPNTPAGAEWTNSSIRVDLATSASPQARYAERTSPLCMLIADNSLGAAMLNDVVPKAPTLLPAGTRPIVIHQAGAKRADVLRVNYATAGIDDAHAQPVPFIDDMAAMYTHTDLVICRAGTMTISEVVTIGTAALFVSPPHVVDDHQTTNARPLSKRGAVLSVPQQELSPASLADILASLTRAQSANMVVKARE